jgi:hypothetical protein
MLRSDLAISEISKKSLIAENQHLLSRISSLELALSAQTKAIASHGYDSLKFKPYKTENLLKSEVT